MIPAGYLLKRIAPPPGYVASGSIADVCSVSDCVNEDVIDLQDIWAHNGFGVANTPADLWSRLPDLDPDADKAVDDGVLFYYEVYEQEISSDGQAFDPGGWRPLSPPTAPGVDTAVVPPSGPLQAEMIGYDVVVFDDFLAHSPLSCNGAAKRLPVNAHCLFDTFEAARAAIDAGAFIGSEDGIYRIFSVSIVTAA